jgi:hypothetical protein
METAIHLEPDNSKWRVRQAQYFLDGGKQLEASKSVAAIDAGGLDLNHLPPALRHQLDAIRRQLKGK